MYLCMVHCHLFQDVMLPCAPCSQDGFQIKSDPDQDTWLVKMNELMNV